MTAKFSLRWLDSDQRIQESRSCALDQLGDTSIKDELVITDIHPSPWYDLYHLSLAVQYEGYWVGFFISQPVFTGSQRPYPNLFFTSSEPVVNLAAILLVILPLIACKLTSNIVYLCFFTQTQLACTRMFHKRLVSPLFYTAPCNISELKPIRSPI